MLVQKGELMKSTLAAFILVLCPTSTFALNLAFQTLDFPGAYSTYPSEIENGVIVGTYVNQANSAEYHGFIYNGATFTTLDAPNTYATSIAGIYGTRLVGSYLDLATHTYHGFIYEAGNFTTIDHPLTNPNSGNGSQALGIYGNNIVGVYI
jgi:hypothetical protein